MDEDKLPHLVEEIDDTLLSWALQNKLTPDMLIAIVLARMTLVAKETGSEGNFIALLDKARYNIMQTVLDDKEKGTMH
jgi:hypothetical protein